MNEQEIEQKQDMVNDHLPLWIEKILKEIGVTPNKESFGACLRSAKMENKKFNDWNDASNTKIPLNEEIFALLEDRNNPEKLRPAVIIAKMMPANRLTWTKNKEGNVLCYDVPAGNFHCCNGAKIKYWKYVNAPYYVNFITGEYIE